MHRREEETRRRAQRLLGVVERAVLADARPLEVSAAHVHGEPVPFAEAVRREFTPFAVGQPWGAAWDTTWFRLRGEVPADRPGAVAVVDLGYDGQVGFGAEALVHAADGTALTGLSPRHRVVRLPPGPVELYVEAAANPVGPFGSPTWPLLGPDPGGAPLYRLARADLAWSDEALDALAADLRLVLGLERVLPEGARRAALLRGLAAVADLVDPAAPAAGAEVAREALAPLLAARAGGGELTLHAVGNSHIDTAWLWPYREARRKVARTLATALAIAAEDPDYVFAVTSPQVLAWLADDRPELFARVEQAVAAGRLEVVGACWVECDGNLPSGEALARQILLGWRWCREHLGVEPAEIWLPDSFGYAAGWPTLAAHAGIRHFVTQKISWNDTNRFPHSTFWWEGPDGSRVLVSMPPADTYNGDLSPAELRHAADTFAERGAVADALYLYGHGDGGGGPTREMLAAAHRAADLDGLPRVRLTGARSYFATVEAAAAATPDLPVWCGELYLETHRGTATTQGRLKQAVQRVEAALRAAELWSAAAGLDVAGPLRRLWQTLLLQQFHDVLPGTSIAWVTDDAHAMLDAAERDALTLADTARAALAAQADTRDAARPVVTFDPTPAGGPRLVTTEPAGAAPPGVQVGADGRWLHLAELPAQGWAAYDLDTVPPPAGPVRVEGSTLDNGRLRVTVDPHTGLLTSVRDLAADREVLAGPGGLLQLFRDEPLDFDAWNVDASYPASGVDLCRADEVGVVEAGPVRATVRVTRRHGRSTYVQTVALVAGSPLVELGCEVDWQEEHRLLKLAFPLGVRTWSATYEVQGGLLHRPTHRNTTWDAARYEVSAQRWAALTETGYGAAVIAEGRHGWDAALDGTLRLTLLRSPTWPDPAADRGRHRIRCALLPFQGDLRGARVTERAAGFCTAPVAVPVAAAAGPCRSGAAVELTAPGVVVEAVKPAEDGSATVIVRLREAYGGRARGVLRPGFPVARWWPCDLLERPQAEPRTGAVEVDLRPFGLLTVALERPPAG